MFSSSVPHLRRFTEQPQHAGMTVDAQVVLEGPLHRAQDSIPLHLVGGEVVGGDAPSLPPQGSEVGAQKSDSE